jgi:hypothetical protein
MPSEAAFSYTGKDVRGNLCTIRGDDYDSFYNNLREVLGEDVTEFAASFAAAFGGATPTPAQAVANVQQVFPGAVPATAPVPAAVPVPVQTAQTYGAADAGQPPVNVPMCQHGPRTFKTSIAKTGRNAGQPWNRWECAVPWSPNAVGRCANVNA